MNAVPEVVAQPSATVLLLRDGAAGLEVLMVTRHAAAAFAGALVFPGGRVDQGDADPSLRRRCRAVAGIDAAAMAHRIAGIRESFEEAHLLLARTKGEARMLAAPALADLEARTTERLGHAPSLAELLATDRIELATDLLIPFAHWITPLGRHKRFDTQFFLAPAPADQVPVHDGREAVASIWITPAKAVAEADAQRVSLVFATRMNLLKLGRSADVAAAIAAARRDEIVTICPELYESPSGWRIRIPPDVGYGEAEMPTQGLQSRD